MGNLTHEMYLANLAMREEIECQARRARAEAIRQFVVAPLARTIARLRWTAMASRSCTLAAARRKP
jgi:hypothetical protein